MATGSIIKDVAKAAKTKAVKSVSGAVFGKGLVGGALGKSFEKKFGDQEAENTDVADALKEQESIQDNNNATLTRIETIVMNIADNIYNIAGVLNAQVVSMKEAHRLQQERAFKSAAATEEANSEALKVEAPTPAATEGADKEKKGGISSLIGSVLSTKTLFKGFLKKFAIFAAGVTAVGLAGFAASTLMSNKTPETPGESPPGESGAPPAGPKEPQIISSTPIAAPTSERSTPVSPTMPSTPGPAPGILPTQAPAQSENAYQLNKAMTSTASGVLGVKLPEPIRSAPAPTPAAPPPPMAATSPTNDSEVAKLHEYFEKPENAPEKAQLDEVVQRKVVIERAISSTKALIQNAKTPEEKAQHEAILKDQLEPGLKATKEQKKAILDKARKVVQPKAAAPAAPASGGGDSGAAPVAVGGGGGGGVGGAGGGASAVPPAPSSGTSIGAASTAVAAASENAPPSVSSTQVNNDTTSGDKPAPTPIPSPIAGRGSLDVGTVFGSGS